MGGADGAKRWLYPWTGEAEAHYPFAADRRQSRFARLSECHVSQEAMDIATLQSQLSKVIYYPTQGQGQPGVHCVTRRNSLAQPCTTPTPSSATASFHWDDAARHIRGQIPAPCTGPAPARSGDMDDEMEDEQAVEDLLNVYTPNQFQFVAPHLRQAQQPPKFRFPTGQQHQQQPFPPSALLAPQPPPQTSSLGPPMLYDATTPAQSASSQFTNTDPFYLAAVQASSSSSSSPFAPSAPSFFAQAARPAPNSPFNLNISAQQGHHALEYESRTVLVGAGQSR
ncbi:hypothetical protein BC826DRAFT_965692 [Russula brevipes]|nr:hypothetical protein BC826DRAFT_965692 [Russula brevipes]